MASRASKLSVSVDHTGAGMRWHVYGLLQNLWLLSLSCRRSTGSCDAARLFRLSHMESPIMQSIALDRKFSHIWLMLYLHCMDLIRSASSTGQKSGMTFDRYSTMENSSSCSLSKINCVWASASDVITRRIDPAMRTRWSNVMCFRLYGYRPRRSPCSRLTSAARSHRVDCVGMCLFIWRLICRQNGAINTPTVLRVQSLNAMLCRMNLMRSGSAW